MSTMHVTKLASVITDFITDKIVPAANTPNDRFAAGFARGAVKYLGNTPASFMAQQITDKLKENGFVDASGNVDIDFLKAGILGGYELSPVVVVKGYTLDRTDGDAILALLEKYRNE